MLGILQTVMSAQEMLASMDRWIKKLKSKWKQTWNTISNFVCGSNFITITFSQTFLESRLPHPAPISHALVMTVKDNSSFMSLMINSFNINFNLWLKAKLRSLNRWGYSTVTIAVKMMICLDKESKCSFLLPKIPKQMCQ